MAGPSSQMMSSDKPFGGHTPPRPLRIHTRLGQVVGATMWLWMFYRAKQDLPHMLVRFLPDNLLCTTRDSADCSNIKVDLFTDLSTEHVTMRAHFYRVSIQGFSHPWDHHHDEHHGADHSHGEAHTH